MNEDIQAERVRLVDASGKQVGIRTLNEALAMAQALDLDLVVVAEAVTPPVCRIMDYGKYKYEAIQRARESRKKSNNAVLKEIKYRPKIGQGDFEVKTRQVRRFLEQGNRVKVTVMFRGREALHPELGKRIMDDLMEATDSIARVEVPPRLDGRNMVMLLTPNRRKQEAEKAARSS